MRKPFQIAPTTFIFINYIGLVGLFAFSLLNLAALAEYVKYTYGVSNHFIVLLPAIKLLLNIDLLFIAALILIYNAIEKILDFKLFFTGALLIGVVSTTYFLIQHKPIVIIATLGLYGLAIPLYAVIVGPNILTSKK
ncbi:hypothetical protein SAMN05446037_102737 [Anaerovirgula multivorans]|uniref:Uncharacterized protein n=1 Tax=Anaerovirgula multivorans TaxID=312168 RepID=A0A239IDQ2_9FIRM|nr:hypothetical protein [Anaerovirgula multivorans]SNS91659.1 hypothetical protein SAMN05446037_102737 [Anaerovirgula multivorans]